MMYRKPLALLCLATLFCCSAGAKTIYVNNGAANAADTSGGLSTTAPLKTIGAGIKLAAAGDTVMVSAGTYTELTSASDVATKGIQIRSVGTASAPITIQAQTPGSVIINQQGGGVGFEIMKAAYVVINGFSIQNCYGGGVHMEEGAPSSNITVENNTVQHCDGIKGDNVGGIYIGGCVNCTITNNNISDIKVGGVYYENGAGIHGYSQTNCTIANNNISNAYTGIFHKRSSGQTGLLITNNVITNVTLGIVYSVGGAGDPPHINQRVYNNIISASDHGIYAPVYETSSPSKGLYVKHNVFLGAAGVLTWGYQGVSVQDNIFYNLAGQAVATEYGTWNTELVTLSNNLFYPAAILDLQQYGTGALHLTTLASFLAATGFPATNKVANPMFVNPTASNYHLQSGSPAIGAADDGSNIGAYPTGNETVGLLSSPASSTTTAAVVPDAPTNVTVQ